MTCSDDIIVEFCLSQDAEIKLNVLRNELIQGEESGTVEYNYKSFIAELDELKN